MAGVGLAAPIQAGNGRGDVGCEGELQRVAPWMLLGHAVPLGMTSMGELFQEADSDENSDEAPGCQPLTK